MFSVTYYDIFSLTYYNIFSVTYYDIFSVTAVGEIFMEEVDKALNSKTRQADTGILLLKQEGEKNLIYIYIYSYTDYVYITLYIYTLFI